MVHVVSILFGGLQALTDGSVEVAGLQGCLDAPAGGNAYFCPVFLLMADAA